MDNKPVQHTPVYSPRKRPTSSFARAEQPNYFHAESTAPATAFFSATKETTKTPTGQKDALTERELQRYNELIQKNAHFNNRSGCYETARIFFEMTMHQAKNEIAKEIKEEEQRQLGQK